MTTMKVLVLALTAASNLNARLEVVQTDAQKEPAIKVLEALYKYDFELAKQIIAEKSSDKQAALALIMAMDELIKRGILVDELDAEGDIRGGLLRGRTRGGG
jgi:hypothetical protein